jgi:hypothetical protein
VITLDITTLVSVSYQSTATLSCRKSTKPDSFAPLPAIDQVNISKSIESISLQITINKNDAKPALLNPDYYICCISLDNKKPAKPFGLRVST